MFFPNPTVSLRGCERNLFHAPWGQGEQVMREENAFPWEQEGPMSKVGAGNVKTAVSHVSALDGSACFQERTREPSWKA